MLKKKILCSVIALSMATAVSVPAVTINVMAADTASVTSTGVVSSDLITAILGNLNNSGLTLEQKIAIVASFRTYLNGNNDQVIKNINDALGSDSQTIKDKFGITSESINAVITWFKSLTLSDLLTINGGTGTEFDALNSSLLSKLTAAGVTAEQLKAFTDYLSVFNSAIANETISAPVLVDSATSGQIQVNTSAVPAFVTIINKYDDKTQNIANSTNVTALLNIFVGQYNAADSATKSALKALLSKYNIYGTVSTPTPAPSPTPGSGSIIGGGSTPDATATPAPSAAPVDVDGALKTVDTKNPATVAAAQKAVDDAVNSAAKVVPAVDTANANEAVMTVSKENVLKAIEEVLAIQAKVAASAAKDAVKVETKVTIEAPAGVTQAVLTASLPAEIVDLLKANKIDNLEVKSSEGTVAIPVELLSAGKNVKLSVNKVAAADTKKAADNAKELAGGKAEPLTAFDYTLLVGGEKQTVFSKAVKVTVNVDANAVKQDSVAAYYIDANGNVKYVGGKYSNGIVTFTVKHFSEYAVLNYTKDFSDAAGNWIASTNYLQQGVKRLIAKGDAKGNFNPNNSITRAEFAAFVARTLQLDLQDYQGTFSDVAVDDWFAQEVEAVKAAGIVDGVGDGDFAPNKNITREEMAKMIANAYSKVTGKSLKDIIGSNTSSFSDFDKVSTWAKDYVAALETLKVVEGSNGTYKPLDNSTRAESLKVIVELADKSELQ